MPTLLPRDQSFFDLLERQSALAVEAARLLRHLLDDFEAVDAQVAEMQRLERRGDETTHEIVRRLHTSALTPIDREDIHTLAGRLDDVLDYLDAVASAVLVYRVEAPTEASRALAGLIVECVVATDAAVRTLRALSPATMERLVAIHREENRADGVLAETLVALFDGPTNPIDVIKWKDIYGMMEGVTDRCQDVARAIETVFVKQS
jgi:predicted phosphate transport protein (TIGR00153 family)